jgi:signal transduction histidine kinase
VTQDPTTDIAAIDQIDAVPLILDVVCRTTGMGFAAVARVTEDRWIACSVKDDIAFGLTAGGELEVESTICHEIRLSGEPVVINNVAEDPQFCSHHTPLQYGFQSYISMPIRLRDGSFFGTLCAIDPRPNQLDRPEILSMFGLFADLIAFHLEAHDRLAASNATLLDERKTAELREQFIAVVGHDLRNPLSSIDAGTRILLRNPPREKAAEVLTMMQSSVRRMASLIDDVLDFARGRLGGGLPVNAAPCDVEEVLTQVVEEIRNAHPGRNVIAKFDLCAPVICDGSRIAQLASNLLGNAVNHGDPNKPVEVRALLDDGRLRLIVSNAGPEIPSSTIERLFRPFERGTAHPPRAGLGLGLYIAAEIAKAHNGALTAKSEERRTEFSFEMPLR